MPRAGPRKGRQYSLEFKLKAVQLSQFKGVEVQAVADALEIHPFMLSRWRNVGLNDVELQLAQDGSVRYKVTYRRPLRGLVTRLIAEVDARPELRS